MSSLPFGQVPPFTPQQQAAFKTSAETYRTLETIAFPSLQKPYNDGDPDSLRRSMEFGQLDRYLLKGSSEINVHALVNFTTKAALPLPLSSYIDMLPVEYRDIPLACYGGNVRIKEMTQPNETDSYQFWNVFPSHLVPKTVITRERLSRHVTEVEISQGLKGVILSRIDRLAEGATENEQDDLIKLQAVVEAQTVVPVEEDIRLWDVTIIDAAEAKKLGALLLDSEQNGTEDPQLNWPQN